MPLDQTLWQTITDEQPESITNQPRLGLLREEGKAFGGQCIVEQRRDRVDVVFAHATEDVFSPFPTLEGTYEEAVREFSRFTTKWLQKPTVGITRIAFGAVALIPQPDRETGYRQLSTLLRCAPDPGATDFLYQINRRRKSSVLPGVEVNRLSKWSVSWHRMTTLPLPPAIAIAATADSRFACRVELDMNTAPGYEGELTHPAIVAHFQELMDLAREILERGDIS